jgi:hypothetical protein
MPNHEGGLETIERGIRVLYEVGGCPMAIELRFSRLNNDAIKLIARRLN